jgi:chemotaxis protein CheD
MSGRETMVRMGELAVASSADEVLSSIGLGSCIGLALVSRKRPLGGLAHVMLPESGATTGGDPGKYADTAVPALLLALEQAGASVRELDAVLVGGAQMFAFGGGSLDIGARNESAVRGALELLRLPVRAAATGSSKGRTIRVHVATGLVLVKEAGGVHEELYTARRELKEAA